MKSLFLVVLSALFSYLSMGYLMAQISQSDVFEVEWYTSKANNSLSEKPKSSLDFWRPSASFPVSTISIPSTDVTWQKSYFRNDGTLVKGHYKTVRNNTNWDNFSSFGNYNPYNSSVGSRAKDYTPQVFNYGSGRTIYTGSRGGQYYINSNGNKTYVPKR